MKRGFDVVVSTVLLILVTPILAVAAVGILIASRGPVLFRAKRVGRDGKLFEMLKLRTMDVASGGAAITSRTDPRIFPFGRILRRLKIDEFPQFWNVLIGDMSIVGPRPEDPRIVNEHYSPWMLETLSVRPGITSIGSIYYYAEGEGLIADDDPEQCYVQRALPAKLAVERAYIERATFLADMWCVVLTVASVGAMAIGRPLHLSARDLRGAGRWHSQGLRSN